MRNTRIAMNDHQIAFLSGMTVIIGALVVGSAVSAAFIYWLHFSVPTTVGIGIAGWLAITSNICHRVWRDLAD